MVGSTTIIKSKLGIPNIYLDTTVFKNANFHYNSQVFKQLITLAEKEKLRLFLTSITIREVESHIRRDVIKAISTIKNCRKEARILRNIDDASYKWLFEDIDENETFNKIFSLFNDFMGNAKIEVIPINNLNIEEVFDKYFTFQPPFSEGKKKDEFPDAFVIQAITEWCKRKDENMYIISNDNDMVTGCEGNESLFSLKKIEELLNHFSFIDVDISAFATTAFDYCKRGIKESIKTEFEFLGFILVDEDGIAENIEVTEIDITNKYLIDVNENSASFNIDAEVTFKTDVSYDDMSTAYKDSDTKDLVPLFVINETISRKVNISCEVYISYEIEDDPAKASLDGIKIEQQDIEVYIDEDTA